MSSLSCRTSSSHAHATRFRVLLAGFFAVIATAVAAAYPERPIRLIVSSAAGASSDVVTRILAAELVAQMGQQIIIDNRPGAVQTIGTNPSYICPIRRTLIP